jgi:copper ion binding protein
MCDSCSCGTDAKTTTDIAIDVAPATVDTFTVVGMTCGHCVSSVSTEVGKLSGVTSVDVDLPTGSVKIASTTPLDRESVRAAVEEAGYELATN